MELHGNDYQLQIKSSIEEIVTVTKDFWPLAVLEKEDDEKTFFIYKDIESQQKWDNGWSEENDTTMILVIYEKNSIWFTIDDNNLNFKIIKEIENKLGSLRSVSW